MSKLTIIESGRKRNAKYSICQKCGKKFLHALLRQRKYCCHKCATSTNQEPNVICAQCGISFYKTKSKQSQSKSGLFFCSRKCKDEAQQLGGIKAIMPNHYGTANGTLSYRDKFENSELVCRRCGYNEFTCGVDIHHIDKDRTNNDKSNLIPLCSNCHKALHFRHWKLKELET